jgi:site-specific DNA recombinase
MNNEEQYMKAAIWWRVSTDEQKDLSPETQKKEAWAMAERDGFQVEPARVLGTDWHSLSVWESPPMEKLRSLIRSRSITRVYVYHPDRLPSKPAHRMMFRALCEENQVSVHCVNGQLPEGEFGEVMEFLDAWSKEKSVKRTQDSSRDGLRDRVLEHHLPSNGHLPYGYHYRYELVNGKKTPVAVEPDAERYFVAQRIWHEAMKGSPLRAICRGLFGDKIPSPGGAPTWGPATVLRILANPVYAGRLHARRSQRVTGKTRDGQASKRAKNSEKKLDRSEWVPLDGFPVESPIVTWEEWEAMQQRLKDNKKWSKRNAHQVYLLSRLIYCGNCNWKLLAGCRAGRENHQYRCQKRMRESIGVAKCTTLPADGRKTDELVWESIYNFLANPEEFLAEMSRRQGENTDQESDIRRSITILEHKLNKVTEMETHLALKNVRGDLSDEAYHRATAMLKAEGIHYREELERQQTLLATRAEMQKSLDTLKSLRRRMMDKLDSSSPEDKRFVLQGLGTRVVVQGTELEISIACGYRSKHEISVADTDVA